MKNARVIANSPNRTLHAYFVLTIIYLCLIFLLPANPNTMSAYGLTPQGYKYILLAVATPSILVWLAAFIGYSRLKDYADAISSTPEGGHFSQLARGSAWLAWSFPVSAISLLILNGLAGMNERLLPTAIILGNYIALILPLIALTIIASAAYGLVKTARFKLSLKSSRAITMLFTMAGIFYCYVTFQQFDLSSLGSTNNPYFLPLWLTVLTIMIPSFYTWFIGLLAAYEINLYGKSVPGVLYRQALHWIVGGLIAVIVSLIAMQYINGLQPRVGYLVLTYKLPLIYMLRIMSGVGFAMIAFGATKLKKIEEV